MLKQSKGGLHGSASQIRNFRLCQRRWWWEKVQGIRTPATPALERGTAVHAVLEGFLRGEYTAQDVKTTAPAVGAVLRAAYEETDAANFRGVRLDFAKWAPTITRAVVPALKCMPVPPLPAAYIEKDFRIDSDAMPVVGRIDLWLPCNANWVVETARGAPIGNLQIRDHKTTSDIESAAANPDKLHGDVQAVIYGEYGFRQGARRVMFGHNYISSRSPAYDEVSVLLDRAQVAQGWALVVADLHQMKTLHGVTDARAVVNVPYDPSACARWGQCPFLARCQQAGTKELAPPAFHAIVEGALDAEEKTIVTTQPPQAPPQQQYPQAWPPQQQYPQAPPGYPPQAPPQQQQQYPSAWPPQQQQYPQAPAPPGYPPPLAFQPYQGLPQAPPAQQQAFPGYPPPSATAQPIMGDTSLEQKISEALDLQGVMSDDRVTRAGHVKEWAEAEPVAFGAWLNALRLDKARAGFDVSASAHPNPPDGPGPTAAVTRGLPTTTPLGGKIMQMRVEALREELESIYRELSAAGYRRPVGDSTMAAYDHWRASGELAPLTKPVLQTALRHACRVREDTVVPEGLLGPPAEIDRLVNAIRAIDPGVDIGGLRRLTVEALEARLAYAEQTAPPAPPDEEGEDVESVASVLAPAAHEILPPKAILAPTALSVCIITGASVRVEPFTSVWRRLAQAPGVKAFKGAADVTGLFEAARSAFREVELPDVLIVSQADFDANPWLAAELGCYAVQVRG